MREGNLNLNYYLVLFIDLLGQRETLRKITKLPTTDAEKQAFLKVIQDSFGRVGFIRDTFKKFFDLVNSYTPNPHLVPSEHQVTFLAALQKPDIAFYSLSDAIVIAVPLNGNDENCTAMNGVHDALIAICGVGLLALSNGVPIRAGIDVGIAGKIDDNEVYGPALERAYYLESNLAEYPRFLIGEELLNYLSWVENKEYNTFFGATARENAKFCKELIMQDTDGRRMIDFLGSKIKEDSDNSLDKEVFISALKFVTSEYEKYLKEGNEILASRYYRLLSYFNSRKSIWEIS